MKATKLIVRRIFNGIARLLTGLICDLDADELNRLSLTGPTIVIVNHVNFLELPIIYPRVASDLGTGYSKVENWDNPIYRLLFNNWDVIPIKREAVDITAMRKGLQALENGRILFITPEGTRSHHGRLQEGKPGVVLMAERSGAPIWPVACYGGEHVMANLKRLKRTDYHVRVGNPFYLDAKGARITSEVRQRIVDEMMYQIAALLPPAYRGVYSDLSAATEQYLTFTSTGDSNLRQVQDAARRTEAQSAANAS